MKLSILSIGLIAILVIAVAFAGCSGSTSQPPAATSAAASGAQATQASGGAAATAAPQGGSASAGAATSGEDIFGAQSYNWVEYKMSAGTGAESMVVYYKYNKQTGTCTMRFETAQKIEGMPTEMDCSSTGGTSTENPNEVRSDVKFVKVGTESVSVPAGTFVADKYTVTVEGNTATYWIVKDKPLIKMQSPMGAQGSAIMELNGWG